MKGPVCSENSRGAGVAEVQQGSWSGMRRASELAGGTARLEQDAITCWNPQAYTLTLVRHQEGTVGLEIFTELLFSPFPSH